MTPSRDLAARFEAYGDWRRRLGDGIAGLHEWLQRQELADAQIDLKIAQITERLHQVWERARISHMAQRSCGSFTREWLITMCKHIANLA